VNTRRAVRARGGERLCPVSKRHFEGDVIVKNLITRFVREDDGQDVVEYALLAAFISIVAATIINSIGGDIKSIFTNVKTQTGNAVGGP
jgi:Flp pilus assembly pilin Flp